MLSRLHLLLALFALSACAETAAPTDDGDEPLDIPGFEDWVSGKDDTGYVGSRAAELEATFHGRVRVMVPDRSAEELETVAQDLLRDPSSWTHRDIAMQVTEQMKYARNALKAAMLNLNLEGGTPTFDAVHVIEGGLELDYTIRVESLVKLKDLEAQNLRVEDLVGRRVEARLPLVPAGLFERVAAQCATDPDSGAAVPAADLGAHNLFYYFDPARQGCPLTDADLSTATLEVTSSLEAPTVYPEYHLLTADGRVTMVAIFGQIEHGELKPNDWGYISFNALTRRLQNLGFRRTQVFENNRGHRLERTYAGGLAVSIDMYTPVDYADSVPREDANTRFRAAIREHEIVYYNGHAFYGSLNVLDDPTAYPQDVYQIIFMDACWSYAYYTKQIFRNRATTEDPEGYRLVDVVNNTEPGITGSEETAAILYDNIFRGAAAVHSGGDASLYSWNDMIRYMNEHAEVRAQRRTTHPNPEIYGASGVVTNAWNPTVEPGTPDPGSATGTRFTGSTRTAIPDNQAEGVSSTIEVPSGSGTVGSVLVEVDIEHPYIGDLIVTLTHGDRSLTLHERSGGSTDNLRLSLNTDAFRGMAGEGAWVLTVADTASVDEGALRSWAITLSR